jgi:hypothetical protein
MRAAAAADEDPVGRSATGLCVLVGSTAGSLLPELWGAGPFSLAAIVLGLAGALGGVWAGARLNDQL